MEKIKPIIQALSKHPNIVAIALGGSRASGNQDEKSDYDVYVYYDQKINVEFRKTVLSEYCCHMEMAVQYFEEEDDCILKDGIIIELIYRNIHNIKESIEDLMHHATASLGYTTCFLDNIISSKVLYEENQCYSKIKKSITYPPTLRENIIKKNMEMLHGVLASYDVQIMKAYERQDMISVNHRIAAYLASYFDIIFAVNNVFHPGEKRLMALAQSKCRFLPDDFEENIHRLLNLVDLEDTLKQLYLNLENLIRQIA